MHPPSNEVRGCLTWVLTKKILNKTKTYQRSMKRKMLRITLKEHNTNQWIRNRTKVENIEDDVHLNTKYFLVFQAIWYNIFIVNSAN